MNKGINIIEWQVIELLRREVKRAKESGAFTDEQKNDELLLTRAALERVATQCRGLSPDTRKALANYRNF